MRHRRLLLPLLSVATVLALAGPAAAAGILPPNNPLANIAPTAGGCTAGTAPDTSPACVSADLAEINAARAAEGVGAMALPTNYAQLTGAQQLFVVTNLERVGRGLQPLLGLADQLDNLAAQGAGHGADPPMPSSGITWAGAIWAGGFPSTLEADFGWMYDDGPGSDNLDCKTAGDPGCWGHRDIILASPAGASLVAGAATAQGSWGTEYAMVFAQYVGTPPPLSYTWSQAVAAGAGQPVAVFNLPSPTRLAGTDRVATSIAVSQATWSPSTRPASAAVIARDDAYPDALAAVPLAAAKRGPVLLTAPSSLDPRVLTELDRILAPGATVYLVGGASALSDQLDQSLAGAGFAPQRIAGTDRFSTAYAIADTLGDPGTVFEANGLNFADALAAGPAAAAAHGAVLLTAGSSQSGATAYYLGAHRPKTYAIGGPAAAADPGATKVVGADRFDTAAKVAGTFFPSASVAGIATGTNYPDALSAGGQLAQIAAPLLLVSPTGLVPTATEAYLSTHKVASTVVYGGVSAVPTLLFSLV